MTDFIKWLQFSDQGAGTVDPASILAELDPGALPAAAPPAEANYRDADMQGIACAFCTKMQFSDWRDSNGTMVPVGVCDQWEARVDGVKVCDMYAESSPQLDEEGKEVWSEFSDVTSPIEYHEIHLAGATSTERPDGRFLKGILRTGEWPVTPTPMGKIKKPLRIIRDGKSDPSNGVIALSEVLDNFKAKRCIKRVQMPFSEKKGDDHIKDGNLARVNAGFVEELWIEDKDGYSELVAACDVRDPDVKKSVQDRTLEDVSSGIPFHPQHGAFLEHVCHTNTPFIDGLSGWITASDDTPAAIKEAEVIHHVLETPKEDEPAAETEPTKLTYKQVIAGTLTALDDQFSVPADSYTVDDATDTTVTIIHNSTGTTWTTSYTVEEGKLKLAAFAEWIVVGEEGKSEQPKPDEAEVPPAAEKPKDPVTVIRSGDPELDSARQLREMRLAASAQHTTIPTGGANMTVISQEELDRLELSDDARAVFQKLLDDNAESERKARGGEVDQRIEELKTFGFSDRPGFLKLYRQIALSDDGGPAAVLLSDDGKEKERVSAKDILDRAIDALRGAEGKVTFSDQHVESGSDNKPPAVDGDKAPVADRVKDARDFLYPNGR